MQATRLPLQRRIQRSRVAIARREPAERAHACSQSIQRMTSCLVARCRASLGGTKFLAAEKLQTYRTQDRPERDWQLLAPESWRVLSRRREEFCNIQSRRVAAGVCPAWNGTDNRSGSHSFLWRALETRNDWKSRSRNKSSARRSRHARLLSHRFNR